MKKGKVINLIKYYAENNDYGFRNEAYQIANEFDQTGDYQLAEYIMALLSSANTFVPQMNETDTTFIRKIETNEESLLLPRKIRSDIDGIINAVKRRFEINKFLFQGHPGTGKTETVKYMAHVLKRDLFVVDFAYLIDSKLGQTGKNIVELFKEINNLISPEKAVILFDEIDALTLNRTDSKDLREMGRATTLLLKELDGLNDKILLIATTNLYSHFDKALIRRFDAIIDFNRYSHDDLINIAEFFLNHYLAKFKISNKNLSLFKKIIFLVKNLPYPGDLKNLIKTSLAFSNANNSYLKKIYSSFFEFDIPDLKTLQKQGFTLREIEILTGISKSQVSRELKR
ncbi:ATP-binding protein [Mycoplasma amphoriforme]|uniref:ATP-binding protein n=1 Tax=Mycoplasma amphoriforme TaxID=273136 RepID=UPI0031B9CCD5